MTGHQKFTNFLKLYSQTVASNDYTFERRLGSYKDEINQIYKENFVHHEQRIQDIFSNYRLLLEERNRTNHKLAYDFSIFNIIRTKRPEEQIHSPFLCELLNPTGTHGQGDVFYKIFLDIILPADKSAFFINKDIEDYIVKMEDRTESVMGNGRIDISIKSKDKTRKFAIIIEIKWNSFDSGFDQLYKYYDSYVKNHQYSNENLLLIYLTKEGDDPKLIRKNRFRKLLVERKGINYFAISYNNHIQKWLTECFQKCESDKVKQTIIQYSNLIKWNQ